MMYTLQKKFVAVFLLSITILIAGCAENTYTHLSQDDARKMMKSNPDAILLDVRTQEEFDKKHIPGALLVPIDELRAGDFSKLSDKNATILIYCWTGRRAEDCAAILVEHGYKNVYEFGGLVDWTGSVSGEDLSN